MKHYDYIIIGAGIMGLTCAHALLIRDNRLSIAIFEKEDDVARHASGRNSGVIHAGIYYAADSNKAKFCLKGNHLLKQFCEQQDLTMNRCGKLIVTKNRNELSELNVLFQRGLANGANIQLISSDQVGEIDPQVCTYEQAIWSPDTASIDPVSVCNKLKDNLMNNGVDIYFNCQVGDIDVKRQLLKLINADSSYGKLINCAGLYADSVASKFGIAEQYQMLPFKGYYLVSKAKVSRLFTNVYPVPNSQHPFLGVHFTITVEGKTKIGPTAVPAFWREQYTNFNNFSVREFSQISSWYLKSLLRNDFGFRHLAWKELCYLMKRNLLRDVQSMVKFPLYSKNFMLSKPGIRAQLYDKVHRQLVNDFAFQQCANSLHILNAVSPAFTSAFAVADYLIERFHNE